MFAANDELQSGTLLQGDVVSGIQLVGAIHLSAIQHLKPGTGEGDATGWTVSGKPLMGEAMVLSHSCEIAPENGVKVTSIILAPVRDVNTATKPERIQELIESNLIDQVSAEASYLKYFYLEPTEHLPYPHGSIVDFSKCFSVRNKNYDYLASRKILQLRPDIQASMALKLALYFHRSNETEAA